MKISIGYLVIMWEIQKLCLNYFRTLFFAFRTTRVCALKACVDKGFRATAHFFANFSPFILKPSLPMNNL
jgi:hypothetical protein